MIAEAMPTRLYWIGLRGIARLKGKEVRLSSPPHLLGVHIAAIDYVPGVLATVMPSLAGWRDMTADERAQADRLLVRLTEGAYACRVDVLSWARNPILMAVHVIGGVAAVSVVAQVATAGVTWPHAIILLSSAALLSATYRALPRGCHDV